MGFIQSLSTTYEGLVTAGRWLGSNMMRPLYTKQAYLNQNEIFMQLLSTSGDGTGTTDMSIDGSITPVDFYIQPPIGEKWYVSRWILYLQDEKGFDVTKWGSNGTLTNGVKLFIERDGVETQTGGAFTTNGDVAAATYDMALHTFGSADDIIVARLAFTEMGACVELNGTTNDKLIVRISDNLSSVSKQTVQAQGFKG